MVTPHGVGDPVGAGVTGISMDSRRVRAGDLYAAIPGATVHGIAHLAAALSAGAVAVLTDEVGAADVPTDLPVLVVPRPRAVLGTVAAEVYGRPAESLRMIGITGTQGKTTTSRLLESGLTASGVPAAVIGTVGTRVLGTEVASALTTPEAPDLHGLLAMMVERGVEACAMEVSSHALVQGRVDGLVFDVAVFLNLGRDHLDFHHDMEDYFSAKAALFTPHHARAGLVDIDGEWGRRLLERAEVPLGTLSTVGHDADWCAFDIDLGPTGSRFRIAGPDGIDIGAGCPITGAFNVANTLAAVAAAATVGYDPAAVAAAIAGGEGVPGRFERVDEGQDFEVVVDFAHKPDAIEAALATLRALTDGRLIVVLGAGGDRDPGKRPLMGRIAAAGADVLVVTDDNPRSEDPAAIRAAILSGIDETAATVLEIGDRRAAITEAVTRAGAGDVVLVAGKGHETGQEIAGVVHPFDDRAVVREVLRR
ncbi:UDP-N-acetylmuramoyl-L-alanyl-D-glutamate--2,6-diaminopimelate ligase [Nocardioides cynanchi]|uniref:UDP-N-acetylmuramoyl-L-alanyl-D-glutamate--2, 6-diaminopimelate ligase n=1 Tax=Nocardioides cynanchi TaxID=2558918 RepID=UPI00307CCB03